MTAASGAPVYGPYGTFIGTGVMRGRMPTYVDMGREAGKAVNHLLQGIPITAIKVPASIPALVQVDWRQVRRWGIDADAIPADAVIHFREATFWETYGTEAVLASAYWTATSAPGHYSGDTGLDFGWTVQFNNGALGSSIGKVGTLYTWCVRGGSGVDAQ